MIDTKGEPANERRKGVLDEAVENADKLDPPAKVVPRIGELAKAAYRTMFRRQSGEETPIATPWSSVNKVLHGGLWPGLHILVSSTGAGKTQFAIQLAIHTALERRPVVYIALELGETEIVARSLAYLASKDSDPAKLAKWSDLLCGRQSNLSQIWDAYEDALKSLPMHVEIAPAHGWSASEVAPIAQAYPGALVIVDYLQLIRGQGRDDVRKTIGDASYQLRMAARDYGCTVLAISSTSRAGYAATNGSADSEKTGEKMGEGDPGRLVGLGKESGDIEFASDTVLVLCAEKYDPTKPARRVHLAIPKHRTGPPAWCELRLVDGTRFEEEEEAEPLPDFGGRKR